MKENLIKFEILRICNRDAGYDNHSFKSMRDVVTPLIQNEIDLSLSKYEFQRLCSHQPGWFWTTTQILPKVQKWVRNIKDLKAVDEMKSKKEGLVKFPW